MSEVVQYGDVIAAGLDEALIEAGAGGAPGTRSAIDQPHDFAALSAHFQM